MKRSFFLIVPLLALVVSCGTGSEFSGQRFQDGVYYHQPTKPEVRLYSKEDFAYLASQQSLWQEQDTLKVNLKSLDSPSVNIYIGGYFWWNRPHWYGSYWYDPFWHDPFWGPWGSRWNWGWYDPYWYGPYWHNPYWHDPWYGPWRPYYHPGWYPYGPGPRRPYGPVYPGYYVPVKTRPSSLSGGGNMTGGRMTRPGGGAVTRPSSPNGRRTSYSTRYYTPSHSSGTRSGGSAVSRPGSSGGSGNYSNSRYYGSSSGNGNRSSYSSSGSQSRSQSSSSTRSSSYSGSSNNSNTRSYGGGGYSGGGGNSGGGGGGGPRSGGRR